MAEIKLPKYFEYSGEKRIALLDTTAISFMNDLDDKGFSPDSLLKDYDVILVPEWVAKEVYDSEMRALYLQKAYIKNPALAAARGSNAVGGSFRCLLRGGRQQTLPGSTQTTRLTRVLLWF